MSALITASLPEVASSRVLTRVGERITYRGAGYLYHFRKSASALTAKLKISKRVMDLFVKRKGFINTIGLKGLTVAEQGGGWYEVFAVDDRFQRSVADFLKRLNQWMLKSIQPVVQDCPKPLRFHYEVTAKVWPVAHKAPVPAYKTANTPSAIHSSAQVQGPSVAMSRLEALAFAVNSRYGH